MTMHRSQEDSMSTTRISRRALLGRAATAAIGLPLLQSIAATRLFGDADPAAGEGAAPAMPKRLCVIYVPHGMYMPSFLPAQVGSGFALSPTLEPLANLRGRFSVV